MEIAPHFLLFWILKCDPRPILYYPFLFLYISMDPEQHSKWFVCNW